MATQSLVRPAAAEVRTMLQRIKMENIERVTSDLSFGGHRGSKLMSTSPRQKAAMFQHQQLDWKQSGFKQPHISE
jgi:hypothetical protein